MRLSEFKDDKALEVVGKLMGPITRIAQNKENEKMRGKGTNSVEYTQALLKNNASEVKEMLAILNDKDPDDYHFNAATLLQDLFQLATDPDLMSFFGFRFQTPASSGSASGSTKGQSK